MFYVRVQMILVIYNITKYLQKYFIRQYKLNIWN